MAALGVTQVSLAFDCGIDVRTVQRWFAGQRVNLADAERVAAQLGVGTAQLFEGVAEDGASQISSRLRMLARLLSARDGAFAQSFRLLDEHFSEIQNSVSFLAHPARGYVSRHVLTPEVRHGFLAFAIRADQQADITIRAQLGRQFSYAIARIRMRGDQVFAVETFAVRSMLAERSADGLLQIWVWIGPEMRELVFVSDTEIGVTRSELAMRQLFDLDAEEMRQALCVRPNSYHLRAAGLPLGFDRVIGTRTTRVDVPLRWDQLEQSALSVT